MTVQGLTTTEQLAQARALGDQDRLAEALARHANDLVLGRHFIEARQELDEAAAIHRERGRVYDEARLTQLAASLCRMGGEWEGAITRAQRAAVLAGPGTQIAIAAHTELGETALAQNDGQAAIAAYAHALADGPAAGLAPLGMATLLRKRAIGLSMTRRYADAAADLSQAYGLLLEAGAAVEARRALVEKATALYQGSNAGEAEGAWLEAMQAAVASADHHAQADLYLLRAAGAVSRGDTDAAMQAAQEARNQALAARAAVSYIGAAISIADLAEARGDRLAAYEALAVGWATLSDLLGGEAARQAFEPKLLSQRERWGSAVFDGIKVAYEARRRVELGR